MYVGISVIYRWTLSSDNGTFQIASAPTELSDTPTISLHDSKTSSSPILSALFLFAINSASLSDVLSDDLKLLPVATEDFFNEEGSRQN
jgi:hypothetical protein